MDQSKTLERFSKLVASGWIPSDDFMLAVRQHTKLSFDNQISSACYTPLLRHIDEHLLGWVIGRVDDMATLEQLATSIPQLRSEVRESKFGEGSFVASDPMSFKDDVVNRCDAAWRAILSTTTPEIAHHGEVQMRLQLLREYGYPMGSNFCHEFRKVGADYPLEPMQDAFEARVDKQTLDSILAKWASGKIDEKTAMFQLRSFDTHYYYGDFIGEETAHLTPQQKADLPFAKIVQAGIGSVVDLSNEQSKERFSSDGFDLLFQSKFKITAGELGRLVNEIRKKRDTDDNNRSQGRG